MGDRLTWIAYFLVIKHVKGLKRFQAVISSRKFLVVCATHTVQMPQMANAHAELSVTYTRYEWKPYIIQLSVNTPIDVRRFFTWTVMTRDSRKWTPMGGPFMRERRGSGPEKQQPKHNPCRPEGRKWNTNGCSPRRTENLRNTACDWSKPDHMTLSVAGKIRHSVSDKSPYDRLGSKWLSQHW